MLCQEYLVRVEKQCSKVELLILTINTISQYWNFVCKIGPFWLLFTTDTYFSSLNQYYQLILYISVILLYLNNCDKFHVSIHINSITLPPLKIVFKICLLRARVVHKNFIWLWHDKTQASDGHSSLNKKYVILLSLKLWFKL